MRKNFNRRSFIKLSATATVASTAALPVFGYACGKNIEEKIPETKTLNQAYIIQLSSSTEPSLAKDYDNLLPRHIYGICWRGNPDDNLRFAKQMGYKYVMYQPGMENSTFATDLHFIFESPDYQAYSSLDVPRFVNPKQNYSENQKNNYSNYFALKDAKAPFPENLAPGWSNPARSLTPTSFSVEPDWQQQRVIDYFTKAIMDLGREKERPEKNFLFGGLAWDVPNLTGDFHGANPGDKSTRQVTLAHWTGKDSSTLLPGTTHEYETYSDGKAAYYIALKERAAKEFPGRRLIFMKEPWDIYENWVKLIETRPDRKKLIENCIFVSETSLNTITAFADDERIFKSGLLTPDWVGTTQPNNHEFTPTKEIVGKAGIHGSWFGWFGRFNKTGGEDQIDHIYDVSNWQQLARVIPSWDNLCGVPLNKRNWDGSEYLSTNSGMNEKVLYSRQPKTNKLFVVFMDPSGSIPLKEGEKLVSVKKVDGYFCETTDAIKEVVVSNKRITILKS